MTTSSLRKALTIMREKAKSNTELGNAFEKLVKVFLENDDTQLQQYSDVWHYSDWAKEHPDYPPNDVGIDLVAKLRAEDEEGYCAISIPLNQTVTNSTKELRTMIEDKQISNLDVTDVADVTWVNHR